MLETLKKWLTKLDFVTISIRYNFKSASSFLISIWTVLPVNYYILFSIFALFANKTQPKQTKYAEKHSVHIGVRSSRAARWSHFYKLFVIQALERS